MRTVGVSDNSGIVCDWLRRIFGRGLGNSIQKLGSVPEAQNDMIFQLSVKNWGFLEVLSC